MHVIGIRKHPRLSKWSRRFGALRIDWKWYDFAIFGEKQWKNRILDDLLPFASGTWEAQIRDFSLVGDALEG